MVLILDDSEFAKNQSRIFNSLEINKINDLNNIKKCFSKICLLSELQDTNILDYYEYTSTEYDCTNSIILTKMNNISYINFTSLIISISNLENIWANYNCPYIDGVTKSIENFFEGAIFTLLGEKFTYWKNGIYSFEKPPKDLLLSAVIKDFIVMDKYPDIEIEHYSLGRYFVDKTNEKNTFTNSIYYYNRAIIINKFNNNNQNQNDAFNDSQNAKNSFFLTIFNRFIEWYKLVVDKEFDINNYIYGYPPVFQYELNRFKYLSENNIFELCKNH
ncbi:hypothetical protein [Spiroplasma sp. SV19]|uniref:hypothetical protein n=1 Tax=Spiroplasma sp. SV19 TaxID=2570468 RepID=UPI0024B6D849|nr:hypothetical protein [Spiroplasma sp. SV19]WHQ37358.1 hypothetical protein E7Y35_05775 [Spiroplasma sp. SV19]